jgi:predicted PurR-regulated permease PerM
MDKQVIVSIKTILFTLLLLLGVYVVYRLGPVFAILVIAGLIVLALEPMVKFFMNLTVMNRPLSRSAAVILSYAFAFSVVVLIFTIGLPPVVIQGQRLIQQLTGLLATLNIPPELLTLDNLFPQFSRFSSGVFTALTSGVALVFTFFSVFIISIYMSLDWVNIKKRFFSLFSGATKHEIARIVEEVETNIGHWFKGELFLMLVVGVLSFIGLLVLGINYPLALALIAGLLEAVPILGPVVSAILVSIVGFTQSPVHGLAGLALFILIQQLENSILVPKIMQRVSGFSPLVILIALLIGSNFFGIIGAILAVPITMVLVLVVKAILRHSYQKDLE